MLVLILLLVIFELVLSVVEYGLSSESYNNLSLVEGLLLWGYGLVIISFVVFVIVGGYYLSCFLFKFVVLLYLCEIFIVMVLMFIIGIVVLMGLVGFFFVLGVFLVGVVFVNSEFRYELEVNIEFFKGFFFGFFFIIVGVGINFGVLLDNVVLIVVFIIMVMFVKVMVLYVIVVVFKLCESNKWLFIFSLVQVGEFGFVLLSFVL